MANLTELSRGSIANIEKGRQQPPLHVLWNIAANLGVSLDTILPIHNEHITLDQSEIIEQFDQNKDLNANEVDLLSQFIKENL